MSILPALDLPFAPFVLNAGRIYDGKNHARAEGLAAADHYRLWTAIEGGLHFAGPSGTLVVPAGGSVLFPPRSGFSLTLAVSNRAASIHFDVLWRPRQSGPNPRERTAPIDASQPAPADLWSCDVPIPLPIGQWQGARQIQEIVNLSWWISPLDHLHANAELARWLSQLIRDLLPEGPKSATDPVSQAENFAIRLLNQATVATMAKAAGLRQSTFTELYQRERGRSPSAFLTELRLAAAIRRISAGEWPLGPIARIIGWHQVETLRRHFRTELGCEPESYRP